jgi:anti-sigma B factor antagonist
MRNGVVDQSAVGGLTVLTLAGELDLSVVPALRRDLARSATATRRDIVADLRQVTFFDCSTIGVLVVMSNQLRATGGSLQLVGLSPWQLRVVTLCQLLSAMPVHDSLQEATAAVHDRPDHACVS